MQRVPAVPEATASTPPRTHVAHAWVAKDIYRMLELEASRRRMHPDRLAAELLTIVVGDDLMTAILER